MFDPLRAKARIIFTIALGFLGGLALASGLGWTGPTYAMPALATAPQVSQEAVGTALALSEAFANAAEAVTPAVVRIEATSTRRVPARNVPIPEEFRQFFDMPESGEPQDRPVQGGGSGFIVSEDGYILTNDHVVADANEIRVYLTDGRYFIATLVGTDPTTDVAVVKIDVDGLPFLSLGSSDRLRVGEWVLAIGNPGFGGGAGSADALDYTVTAGIVSAKGRPLQLLQSELRQNPNFGANAGFAIEDYIQTDAVINRGNSGGPMVNILGQVVGINSAIFSPSGTYVGYGFAIPIDLAARVMEDLIEYGSVRRAWLGVEMVEIAPEDQEYYNLPEVAGVLVQRATEGGPAERAGLRQGDVLYSVDGKVVRSPNGLQNFIAQMRPGAEVTLRIYRERSARDYQVRLGEAPFNNTERPAPEAQAPAAEEKLGIGVQELTPELAERLGYEESGGVVITQVTPLGPASRRGVGFGEKILQINGEPVAAPDDVGRILRGIGAGEVVSLRLGSPDGTSRIVNVRAGR
ncbi:MAG: trypsin-like peptidase domain-containing protein [Gemmatimonadota bacterium]